VEKPVEEAVVKAAPPKKEVKQPQKTKLEYQDKIYVLTTGESPIVFMLKSRGCLWFDDEKGYEREIKYCDNQKTIFVDEMQGPERLTHIVFRDGNLYVPKEKQTLQKYLADHADNGSKFE